MDQKKTSNKNKQNFDQVLVGDYYIKINVSIPKNLTKEDRDDITRIAKKYS